MSAAANTPEHGFEYVPPMSGEHVFGVEAQGDSADQLNNTLARLEALRVKILNFPMLPQQGRHELMREIDLLRTGLLQIASEQKRVPQPDMINPSPAQAYLQKDAIDIDGIIGNHPAIEKILYIIKHVARSDLTVLIEGETGTGKELFSRIIHLNSGRGTFVAVNCGAFPSGVIESELFGHVRGAFTGATMDRKGKFEEADGGTIFLDEIGELEPTAQVKLLRALEYGEIQRVGSDSQLKVDVRVIAATNRNLEDMVREGTFREDLYYRINVCPLWLPPLRERRDEIEILLEYFFQEACARLHKPIPRLSSALRNFVLRDYNFPGNIRELKNMAQLLAAMSNGRPMEIDDLPARYTGSSTRGELTGKSRSRGKSTTRIYSPAGFQLSREEWVRILANHHGNVQKICTHTGLSRSRVYDILKQLKLKPKDYA